MRVAVFGLGYVGTVTAACLAANGHDVWGVDVSPDKVATIAAGKTPVVEPGLDALVADSVASGALHATMDASEALAGADISLVCVGTPSSALGSTDLSYVRRAVSDIGRVLASRPAHTFHSVVVRSTVPPGTVEDVVTPVLAACTGGSVAEFGTGMCPEFLREGTSIADFYGPPFTVVGTSDPRVAESLTELFGFLERPVRVVETKTAEALKYACNAFHATKVSFANELGRLFKTLRIDTRDVMELFCEDTQLNISPRYLKPGFAFGGSCLPKDLRSLLYVGRMGGVDLPLLSGTLSTNYLTVSEVVDRVVAGDGRRVALLGLSFKMNSDDLRESPYVDLAETLIGKGFDVRIYDPIVNPSTLVGTNRQYVESRLPHLRRILSDTPVEALVGADAAVVSTSHGAVMDALLENPPPRIIDVNGRLVAEVEALAGYEGVGW